MNTKPFLVSSRYNDIPWIGKTPDGEFVAQREGRFNLTISRPNTIGVTWSREYDSYADAESFIERKVERWTNKGWEASELSGSNSEQGCIELTHDEEADSILVHWHTIVEPNTDDTEES
jgi:hypothetical protein